MKIFFYDEATCLNHDEMSVYFTDRIRKRFEELGHEVIFYAPSVRAANLIRSRHFQMYEDLFDAVKRCKADLLFHNYHIAVPEYFLSELKAGMYPFKIVFLFSFREINRSLARTLVLKELIERPEVKTTIALTMLNEKYFVPPENYKKIQSSTSAYKVKLVVDPNTEPHYDSSLSTSWLEDGVPRKRFRVGYFGRWTDAKSPKLLLEAMKYMDKDVQVCINMPKKFFGKQHFKGVEIDSNYYKLGELRNFLEKIDAVICPHSRLYEYGQTGMPATAYLAKKPIIAPDFYYFNKMVQLYKTGLLYKPEDPISLGLTVSYLRHKYHELMIEANFDKALGEFPEVEIYADKAVED
jgi:glycosyltransferase involved in cell wall biosynthesis